MLIQKIEQYREGDTWYIDLSTFMADDPEAGIDFDGDRAGLGVGDTPLDAILDARKRIAKLQRMADGEARRIMDGESPRAEFGE